MFPSSGYFRAIPCPFYVNGLCERPFCHFRHTKQDQEKAKDDVPSYSTASIRSTSPVQDGSAGPKPFDPLQPSSVDSYFTSAETSVTYSSAPKSSTELLRAGIEESFSIPSFTDSSAKYSIPAADEEQEQYLTASPEKQTTKSGRAANSKVPSSKSNGDDALPTYFPTPKTPSLPPASSKSSSSVPVYQPTPKRELKRRNGDSRRLKDMEYDPENNFSCGGLSSNQSAKDEDDLEYKPTQKKAKLTGQSDCLSYDESQDGRPLHPMSYNAEEGEMEDEEGPPDGQFSDDEPEPEPVPQKTEEDSGSEDFQSIDDDDISSDDDLIEVPDDLSSHPGNNNKAGNKSSSKRVSSKIVSSKLHKDSKNKHVHKTSEKSSKSAEKSHSSISSKSKSSEKSKAHSDSKLSSSSSHKKSSSSSKDASSKHGDGKKTNSPKRSSSKDGSGSVSSKTNDSGKIKTEKSSSKKSLSSGKNSNSSDRKSSSSSSRKDSADGGHSSRGKHSGSGHSHKADEKGHRRDSSGSDKTGTSGKRSAKGDSHARQETITLPRKPPLSLYSESGGFLGSVQTGLPESKGAKTHSSKAEHKSGSSSDHKWKLSTEDLSKAKRTSSTESFSSMKRKTSTDKSSKPDSSSHSLLKKHNHSSTKQDKSGSSHSASSRKKSGSFGSGISAGKKDSTSGKELISRMNSDLFGEDTSGDEDFSFPTEIEDDNGHDSPADQVAETSAGKELDYSSFIHDSDFEDEDTFDECLRIFKESAAHLGSVKQQEKQLVRDSKLLKTNTVPESNLGKKRVAHASADQIRRGEALKKERPRQHLSPAQVMHNRIMEMQRRALERAAKQAAVQEQEVSSTSGSASKSSSSLSSSTKSPGQGQGQIKVGEKKRVAHVPKPPAPSPSASTSQPAAATKKTEKDKTVTVASTASKTEKRIAHAPNLSNLKRPVIPATFGSKVPSNIRQRYLNLIIDECLKFCLSEEEAYKKGLEEETGVYDRASNKNIYLRVAVNTITRLRAEAKESAHTSSSPFGQRRPSVTQSHQATLGGSRAAKTSFTLHRSSASGKKTEVALTGPELYEKLLKYAMTDEQLVENGYPRPSPDTPGKAVCYGTKYKDTDSLLKSNERTCARCGTRFIVNADGSYLNQEECVYHWTRAYPRKKSGFIQNIYNCCNSDTSSKGCQIAANHVHEKNKQENLTGFMKTMPHSPPPDGNYRVYALDCEMVYTLGGIELARVTVIDTDGKTVFESLVKPSSPIVDYNTRFSGLTEADLKDVKTTLTDVQAILLSMFSDKTILIGHSLESDLFALKLIHSTVVDTSVVFPHRLGPPYKRALKNLMLETFQKIIQSDDGGHDSKEDAVACLDLIKWRIKEDSRRENRYS